jgi:transcriptional regulator with XRE-family HTH domain
MIVVAPSILSADFARLGEQVVEARLSRAELARRAAVLASTLRHRENDRGFPGVPAFLPLAEALGMPVERLAEGGGKPGGGGSGSR